MRIPCAPNWWAQGAIFQSTSDTETIVHLAARSTYVRIVDKLIDALRQVEGAYSLVALTSKKLIGVRDPCGVRPLVLGKLDGALILASETCALDIIGAEFVRDIKPGEMVVITKDGIESHFPFKPQPHRFCVFEYIYFARPDSTVEGRNVYEARKRIGEVLARGSAGRRRHGDPGAGFRRARGAGLCQRRPAFPSSSASSATIMSAAPSSSRPTASAIWACA